ESVEFSVLELPRNRNRAVWHRCAPALRRGPPRRLADQNQAKMPLPIAPCVQAIDPLDQWRCVKKGPKTAAHQHSTPYPAAPPDGGRCGEACLRRGRLRSRLPAKQAGRAKPRGWRGRACSHWRDKEKKALAVAIDCVGVIVRCVSSPLTSAEQALLIGALVGWQPSRRAGSVSARMAQPQLGGHSG